MDFEEISSEPPANVPLHGNTLQSSKARKLPEKHLLGREKTIFRDSLKQNTRKGDKQKLLNISKHVSEMCSNGMESTVQRPITFFGKASRDHFGQQMENGRQFKLNPVLAHDEDGGDYNFAYKASRGDIQQYNESLEQSQKGTSTSLDINVYNRYKTGLRKAEQQNPFL